MHLGYEKITSESASVIHNSVKEKTLLKQIGLETVQRICIIHIKGRCGMELTLCGGNQSSKETTFGKIQTNVISALEISAEPLRGL